MKRIILHSNYWLEISHKDNSAFRVRIIYEDKKIPDSWDMGTIYGNFIKELKEDDRSHWQLTLYLETDNPIKMSETDFKQVFIALKNNSFFSEPASMITREVSKYITGVHKRLQTGRIYHDDPDPYPSLEENMKE